MDVLKGRRKRDRGLLRWHEWKKDFSLGPPVSLENSSSKTVRERERQ